MSKSQKESGSDIAYRVLPYVSEQNTKHQKAMADVHKEISEMLAKREADFLWSCFECVITKQSIEHLKTCTKEIVVACLLYLGVTMNNYKASILDKQVVDVFRNGSFVRSYSRNEW